MANTLSNSGIVDGQIILASQVTQIVDAFTSASAYDIAISGSLTVVGQANITASNAISASYALSASYEIVKEVSSSYAETASLADLALLANTASYASTIYNVDGTINDSRTVTIDSGDLSFQVNSGDIKIALATDGENFVITGLKTESISNIMGINSTDDVVLMATSSIQNVVSSSYALSSSYASNALSSSYALTASFTPGIRVDGLNDLSTATNVKVLGFTGVNMLQVDSETAIATIVSSSYAVTASHLTGGVPAPNLQSVTTAGASTSASISLTNTSVATTTIAGNGNNINIDTIDNTTPLGISLTDGGLFLSFLQLTFNPATGVTSIEGQPNLNIISTLTSIQSNTDITGSLEVKGNVTVSGSQVLTLEPVDPLPSSPLATGSFAVSASVPPRPYMWDGSAWYAL